MESIVVHLKNKPTNRSVSNPCLLPKHSNRLEVGGLDRVVAVKIDGLICDLSCPITSNAELDPVYVTSDEGIHILRHSASHVMAMAVKELFPGVKVTIGPAIAEGFYYDFDYERPFKEEDLKDIEEKMEEIIRKDLPFIQKRNVKPERH